MPVELQSRTVRVVLPAGDRLRYGSLDALRGIAAMTVVIHHSMMTIPLWSDVGLHGIHRTPVTFLLGTPPLDILWAGDAAVRVFFALSGFVLALMFLRGGSPGYAAFVAKRICRIYLPYLAVVAVAMLLMTTVGTAHAPELSEWFHLSWTHGVTWPLVLDHALMLGRPEYNFVDNPIWSLVHETRYSLVFPLLMWAVIRVRWPWPVAVSLLVSLAAMGTLKHTGRHWAVDSLQYAFLFVAGAVLAKHRFTAAVWFRGLPAAARIALGITSVVLLSAHGIAHSGAVLIRAMATLAPHLGAVLLLLSLLSSTRVQTLLDTPLCLWLGRVSYSLYLSHVVVLLTLVSLLHGLVPISWILVALPFLSLAVAGGLHRVLEQPAIALGRSLESRINAH